MEDDCGVLKKYFLIEEAWIISYLSLTFIKEILTTEFLTENILTLEAWLQTKETWFTLNLLSLVLRTEDLVEDWLILEAWLLNVYWSEEEDV